MTISKSTKFNRVLISAKNALDSINVKFHLHAGTALGAYREEDFIKHDHDIDLAVFFEDLDTPSKVDKLKYAMKKAGFTINATLGKQHQGYEIQFEKNDVPLDIFWIYKGHYKSKDLFIISSYYGDCDNYKHKSCIYGYRPYRVQTIMFLGKEYKIVPKKTLVDMYGKTWNIVKKYTYEESITNNIVGSLIRDYYEPEVRDSKVAFCFLLYDKIEHQELWKSFFLNQKGFSLYSHIKKVTDETPKWLLKTRVPTIKTGWCQENLVRAWVSMLKKALLDKDNKYFALLSGSCIPLFDFITTWKKIFRTKKSRINIETESYVYQQTGFYYADQWCILNRTHAQLLIDLYKTQEGKDWRKNSYKYICTKVECFCPDEIYPVNWFIENYGKPSTPKFKSEFIVGASTFTKWEDGAPHPIKWNATRLLKKKNISKICGSKAIFARKFNDKAAELIGKKCKEIV